MLICAKTVGERGDGGHGRCILVTSCNSVTFITLFCYFYNEKEYIFFHSELLVNISN